MLVGVKTHPYLHLPFTPFLPLSPSRSFSHLSHLLPLSFHSLTFPLSQVCTALNQVRWSGGYGEVSKVLHSAGRSVSPTLFSHADVQGEILEGLVVFIGEAGMKMGGRERGREEGRMR